MTPRPSKKEGGRPTRKGSARPTYKKKHGQHHLRSGELCRPLLDFLRPEPGLRIVEIGPGGGVLTRELVAAGSRVLALELDLEWAFHLGQKSHHWPAARSTDPVGAGDDRASRLRILGVDALRFPWDRLRQLPGPTLLTGNLPFNVGTPLVDETLEVATWDPEALPRLGYMVQKEVADRLVAEPGDGAYGALSVLVAARAHTRLLGTLAPGAFKPPPRVSAAFVGLLPRRPPVAAEDWPDFRRLVFLAFAQRRKTLANSLGSEWGKPRARAVLERAGIDPRSRAEALALGDFLTLHGAAREEIAREI